MKKVIKKSMAFMLSVVLILSTFITMASAATTKKFILKATPEYTASEVTGVIVTLNAKNCVGFTSAKFVLSYDSNVLTYTECDYGKDTNEVNNKCNPEKNTFVFAVKEPAAGKVNFGCYFLEKLMRATDFKTVLKKDETSINVNTSDFEMAKFYFKVKDKTAAKTSFDVTCSGSSYITEGCSVEFGCSHPSYTSTIKKATVSTSGKKTNVCKVCGKVMSSTSINRIDAASIKLSYTKTSYTGVAKKPTVTVKDIKGNKLVKDTDYTVSYSNNVDIGTANAKITFKGNYSGTKTFEYVIKPAVVTNGKFTSKTDSVKLSWASVKGAATYRIYKYNSTTKTYTQIDSVSTTSCEIKNLSRGTAYTYYVKASKNVDGVTYLSKSFTKILTATKTSAPSITLTAGSKKITAKWASVKGATGYQFAYATSKTGAYKTVNTTKLSCTKSSLTTGKTYYVKVRAYKTVGDAKVYSAYSTIKSVKVK